MNIVKHKNIFFIISGILIIPGIISLSIFGLKQSIDFTGGSELSLFYKGKIEDSKVEEVIKKNKTNLHSIKYEDKDTVTIRTDIIEPETKTKITEDLRRLYPDIREESFDTVGPTIGEETKSNAFKAVLVASLAIMAYIAFVFRQVSKPVSSWKYGVCAVIALLHDVIIVVGIFSILGVLLNVEIDSLFITALLTVMGFSVHDTIVVFDRIRENLRKNLDKSFEEIVNNSLLETINRSLNTSITVVIVLFALLVFGGESIRWFVVALLVGIIAGTYSSIFNASQLLVLWYEWDRRKKAKK